MLSIHNGSIIGNGTINGNLTLGYDPNIYGQQQSNAMIAPGFVTSSPDDPFTFVYTPGTLAITQSFQMFASGTSMYIDITASGAFDKVTVGGYAALSGTLVINPSRDYHPPPITITFLTASTFADGSGQATDFSQKTVTYWGSWLDPQRRSVHWTLPTPNGGNYSLVAELSPGS